MAGKSTFLRTLGVNVLLSQTLCMCFASEYVGCFYRIVSSISKIDSLLEGKSYYFAECERLLKIVNISTADLPSLCLIDEVLSGTNSHERIRASKAILKYLYGKNLICVVATHDVEMAKSLDHLYENYHFSGEVDHGGLTFDYELKKGVVGTSNAIQLLAYLEYPREIIDDARSLE